MKIKGIVFDGDDTLWSTEVLYDDARQLARAVVESAGLDGGVWEERQRRVDVEKVAALGCHPGRFPISCRLAYESMCEELGQPRSMRLSAEIHSAAKTVFATNAEVHPAASDVLSTLSDKGVVLALLTKGDYDVQMGRIDASGLAGFFDVISVVEEKTSDVVGATVGEMFLLPQSVCSVGNSVRSDILPAVEAGLFPILLDAHVWEYEREHDHLAPEGLTVIGDLGDLLETLEGLV